MATTEPENLVDTIRSRSQHFHFRALTFAEITGRLEEIAAKKICRSEGGALAVIARMAEVVCATPLLYLEQTAPYCGDTIRAKEVRELLGVVPDEHSKKVRRHRGGIADRSASVRPHLPEGRPKPPALLPRSDSPQCAIFVSREGGRRIRFGSQRRPDQRPALARAVSRVQ